MEILRKTRFPQVRGAADVKSPETILEHEYASMLFLFSWGNAPMRSHVVATEKWH